MLEKIYGKYWQTVIDTMMEGLMLVDPDGKIVFVNPAFEQLTGYTKEEVEGQTCEMLGCDTCFGTREEGKDKYCALFKEGKVRRRKCIFEKKGGGKVHVLKNAALIRDKNGKVVGGVENLTDLSPIIEKEEVILRLRKQLNNEDGFHGMLGKSAAMKKGFDLIASAAPSEAPVVIYGESGTGKELAAAAIHRLSARHDGPFIKVNCAALNENLLESELFGHVKGAFTGADRTRVGRFEAANKGTMFLDEIGDLPLTTQTKLLRVLQEKEFERVGDHRPIATDVRILAATNKDLNKLMQEKLFREDLYYRISVIPIYLPPLRVRLDDIPLLVDTFVRRMRLKTEKNITGIAKEVLDVFMQYRWPGNIRELINVIEYAFVLCPEGDISIAHLPAQMLGQQPSHVQLASKTSRKLSTGDMRQELIQALQAAGGNKSEAARRLGISRVTLWKRIKKFDIQVDKQIRE
ncbi:MAG: sigma 54-interacting transcriptional regulator [Desulfobulbaceae bacterium]|nr:sigma 54-interacting transcriptional regulator [Desulfobulbaceae bacterium]